MLTYGANSYTYDFRRIATSNTRLIKSTHREEQWSQKATVILNDSDLTLTGLDLEGYKGVISYGFTTSAGDEYTAAAPLWVVGQQRDSMQGKVLSSLSLEGIFDRMAKDKASTSLTLADTETKTIKTFITQIAGATLAPYTHCKAYTVTYDSEDSLIDSFAPADYFRINLNDSRLSKIRELLSYTMCRARAENDGNIHVLVPRISGSTWAANTAYVLNDYVQPASPNDNFTYQCTTAGTSHATTEPTWPTTDGGTVADGTVTWTARAHHYEYSLADTFHTFLSKRFRRRVVSPNYIVVRSHPDHTPSYTGFAKDDSADLTDMEEREYHYVRATSNAQCTSLAKAYLSRYQLADEQGAGILPIMNIAAEVYDYNKITDSRASDNAIGNVGWLTRKVAGNKFGMDFGFGTPSLLPLEVLAEMATGQAAGVAGAEKAPRYVSYDTLMEVLDNIYGNFESVVTIMETQMWTVDSMKAYITDAIMAKLHVTQQLIIPVI